MNDVAAPVVAALSKADNDTKEQIKNSVFDVLNKNDSNGSVSLDYGTIIISGKKD
jgi:hypothetical protein